MNVKNKGGQTLKTSPHQGFEGLFVDGLLNWNRRVNSRQMPWKGETDPYKIWLSEVILQQTRVEQGLKYYENFTRAFPEVHTLANAHDDKVLKLWEGLGYYSRCRNLITAARYISNELHGIFPKTYEDILQLKGVGSYTAAAIASFAYNLPYAVVDGNVFRVLSRIFDLEIAIDSGEGKKQFSQLAQRILPEQKAGEYNQAIMDFGAVICKPLPECGSCFFNNSCRAYLNGRQDLLPVKGKKLKIRERWLNYFIIRYKDQVLIRQRSAKDIWQQLFEFVLIETNGSRSAKKLEQILKKQYGISGYDFIDSFHTDQKLTHQYIHFLFTRLELSNKTSIPGFFWAKLTDLQLYAFPKSIKQFIVSQLL